MLLKREAVGGQATKWVMQYTRSRPERVYLHTCRYSAYIEPRLHDPLNIGFVIIVFL